MAAKKGYNRAPILTDEHRGKIANSNILNALIEHVQGTREMAATQVSAGIALLKKVLPDLQATDHTTKGEPITGVQWLPSPSLTPQDHNSARTTNGKNGGPS